MIIKFKIFESLNESDPFGEEIEYGHIYSMDDYWELVDSIPYLIHKCHEIDEPIDFDWIAFAIDYPDKEEISQFEIWPSKTNITSKVLYHLGSGNGNLGICDYKFLTECTEEELMDKISLLIENN